MSRARAAGYFGATACNAGGGVLRRALAFGVAMVAALAATMAGAQSATPAANQLQDVRVETLPGNQVQLELKMSGADPTPPLLRDGMPPPGAAPTAPPMQPPAEAPAPQPRP